MTNKVVIGCLLILLSNNAYGNDDFSPPDLNIVWEKAAGRLDSQAVKSGGEKTWTKSCVNIAKSLIAGKAPWGLGIFKNASCFIDGKKIAGKERTSPWILKYNEGQEFTTLKLYSTNAKDSAPVAQVQLPGNEWAMFSFYDEGFADLVGLRILNELPAMGVLKLGALKASLDLKTEVIHVPPSGIRLYKSVPPPEQLTVFQGTYLEGNMFPRIKGSATKGFFKDPENVNQANETKEQQVGRPSKKTASVFELTWTFNEVAQAANKDHLLLLQDARGAGKLIPELDASIAAASALLNDANKEGILNKFLSGVKNSFASGYVGVRYGVQVLSGNKLIKKTKLLGVVAEVPLGPISGIRYYYDKIPKQKQTIDGLETNIEYSRHIIGKAFSMTFSHVIDRLEFTPKIGMWTFNAKLVDSYNDDGTAATVGSFNLNKGLSFSLEAGVEWLSQNYTIRPWYSYDYANALNKLTSKKVTASRVGLDSYFRAGPTFKFLGTKMRSAFLVFFMYESIGLSSSNSATVLDEGDRQIEEITFSSG